MRPLLLKGHERSITCLKYNREGDLIYTTSKHPSFACWRTDNGERLGTFDGHMGAVWSVDVDRHTTRVLSGAGDNYAKIWDAETGRELISWQHKAPIRSVDFSLGDRQFISVTDQVLGYLPTICIWDTNQGSRDSRPLLEITGKNEAKILQAVWGPLNKTILTANEDGRIVVYDVRTGGQLKVIDAHLKAVMQLNFSKTGSMFITASKDGFSKLYDSSTYQHLKTYFTGRPINSASISPLKEEVILGGGQSADTVTTSRVDKNQFNVRFFHSIFEDEIGSVQGHFGPVNVLSFSPEGDGFASGGEDGYVRLHHFDKSYLTKTFG